MKATQTESKYQISRADQSRIKFIWIMTILTLPNIPRPTRETLKIGYACVDSILNIQSDLNGLVSYEVPESEGIQVK